MSREDIRRGVAAYFGGPDQDEREFYRSSPLAGLGLSGVLPYYVSRVEERDYWEGLDSVRTGAVMCVHLADDTEKRLAIGGYGGGILDAPYGAYLYLYFLTLTPSPSDAQADRDVLLEAVKAMIRADPTLGMGINSDAPTRVTQAGEGEAGITTSTPVPYFEPPARTMQNAVISFTANTYPAG